MKLVKGVTLLSAAITLAACGSSSSNDEDGGVSYPSTYEFSSKFQEGQSSVKFTGQAARQLLIDEMKNATGNSEVTKDELTSIYSGGSEVLKGENIYGANTGFGTPVKDATSDDYTAIQIDYTKVYEGAGSKKLSDKIAGCDNELSASQFIGWEVTTLVDCGTGEGKNDDTVLNHHDAPHSLILEWIDAAAANAVDADLGLNYQQLFQKFLLGSLAFSQTAEDYLDTDNLAEKDNSQAYTSKGVTYAYTALEHSWDEGFGYLGASTDYLSIADATIDEKINHSDVNGDGEIDLLKGEYNLGLAQYASKHDVLTGTTDLSSEIMIAFLEGRQLIQDNHGTNPADDSTFNTELAAISNRAVQGMEKIFAISVIKYINQTIDDLDAYAVGSEANDVISLAKHWSELKGFALGLQFSPISTFSEAELVQLHGLIGQSPIKQLENVHGDKALYIEALEAARTLVQEKFGFDVEAVKTWG